MEHSEQQPRLRLEPEQRRAPSTPSLRFSVRGGRRRVTFKKPSILKWQIALSVVIFTAALIGRQWTALDGVMTQIEAGITVSASENPMVFDGLTYLNGLWDDSVAVMAPVDVTPVLSGKVTRLTQYDEPTYDVEATDDQVCALADGQVFYLGEDQERGTYVVVNHSGGYRSYYWQMTPQVSVGDQVETGDVLGSCAGAYQLQLRCGTTAVALPQQT